MSGEHVLTPDETERVQRAGALLLDVLNLQRDTLDFVKTVDSRLVAQQAHWGGRLEERIARLEQTVLTVLAELTSDSVVSQARKTVRLATQEAQAAPQTHPAGQQAPRKPGRPRTPITSPDEPESDVRARLAGFSQPVTDHSSALAYLSAGLMIGRNRLADWLANSPDLEALRVLARHVRQVQTLATDDRLMLWLAEPPTDAQLPRAIQVARGADVTALFNARQMVAYQEATKG